MKSIKIIIVSAILMLTYSIKSQVSVNVNIGSPPLWGPVGYTTERYYYLPDVEAYYDIQTSQFIYFGSGVWIHNAYLPGIYRNYDLYNGYKVVIKNYRGNTPYVYFKNHKIKYKKGYRGTPQKTIGQRPGNRNFDQPRNSHNEFNERTNLASKQNEKHRGGGAHGNGNNGKRK